MGIFDNKYLAITIGDFEFDYSKKGKDPHASLMSVIRPKRGSSLTLNKDLVTSISTDLGALIPDDFSISIINVLSASYGTTSVLNASFGTEIDLTSFPILKDFLPSGEKISINSFQLLLSTGALTKSGSKAINDILPRGVAHLPSVLKKDFSCTASLQIGRELYSLDSSGGFGDMTSSGSSGAKKPAKINPVHKKLGPVGIGGVSLGMHDGEIALTITGTLFFGPFGMEFIDFTASTPLHSFSPSISLKGLAVDLNQPPLTLDGMFLNESVSPGSDLTSKYDGSFSAIFGNIGVMLEGSYAKTTDGVYSIFMYGGVDTPAIGPPFLYLEGFAAGFGVNRGMDLPAPGNILKNVMISPLATQGKPADFSAMDKEFPIKENSYWAVAGIKAGSFKMIDTILMLAFRIDRGLEVDVIGYADMKFPKPKDGEQSPELLAELQVGYTARYIPDRGIVSVSGAFLPGSYIYNPSVHISGGYAMLSVMLDQSNGQWKGASAGDFVFTIGGYAKNYSVQSYYPKVPRLQMSWAFSSDLYIKAQAYFAITPDAMMAGGWLDANFEEGGDLSIHVHFTCGADFIIYWKPYHYSGEIYANLHVSARLSIDCWLFTIHVGVNFDLGADLQIWGPSFSGHASIHVHVLISFTVGIGFGNALNMPPPALDWADFSNSFLPEMGNIITGQITSGLIASKSSKDYQVVNKKEIGFIFKTAIPIKQLENIPGIAVPSTAIGIKPMHHWNFNDSSVSLKMVKTVGKDTTTLSEDDIKTHFKITPIIENVPAALWQPNENFNGHLVERVLTGFQFRVIKPQINEHSFTVPAAQVDILNGGDNNWGSKFTYSSN